MNKLSLCGIWQMEGGGYSCEGTVPGSVYSFLLDARLIDDPFYRLNELTALAITENDFCFSKGFKFSKPQGDRVLLHCDGLDTLCDVFINGKLIGKADNMYRSFEFDATDALIDGDNTISVNFHSPTKYIREKNEENPIPSNADTLPGFVYLRKASYMMGWDWGPRLPDAGIWKDIYLLTVNSDRLEEVHITQRHEDGKVFVTPAVRSSKGKADIRITVNSPSGNKFELPANVETEIENPMLWWPRGLGEPNLYTFTTELIENGKAVDRDVKRIGLRVVRLIREEDEYGESFCHEVNGIRFFAMGADYIPEDSILSRITKERTERLIKTCVESNFNTVRIWGGGFYPHDFFFDACDENGIVVFEDLMFACMNVPNVPELIESIKAEIRENLIRTRHHACVAVISGNNEIEVCMSANSWQEKEINARRAVYLKIFEHIIPEIVKEICPYIPYIPSSPSSYGSFIETGNENRGDSHYWSVWHGNLPFAEYRKHYFRYLSEFGFESFPCEKTVNTFTLPEDRNIFSRVMESHQKCTGANKKIISYLSETFLYPHDFSTLLYASQLLQAEAIRYAVEHLRRNRGRCMGALYWQLNDVWPVASWSSIDYYGRYKALQYVAKRFFAPVMISCRDTGEVMPPRPNIITEYTTEAQLSVANETLEEICGQVNWELRTSDGKIFKSGTQSVTVAPLSTAHLDNMAFEDIDIDNTYFSFSFAVDGKTVSEGTSIFTLPKYFKFKNPNLRYEINGDEITVFADAFAKYVEIDSPDSDFILSDNYFDMNAGQRTVKILEGAPKTIRLRSVYDVR